MITKEKLAINLKVLKSRIPPKPTAYTPEHPKTISEALVYYCNQRTVHSIQACTSSLNADNWPLPLWFDPGKIRVGFWNQLYYRKQYNSWQKEKRFKGLKEFDFFSVAVMNHILFRLSFDQILIEAFNANKKYAFQMLLSNSILKTKIAIVESVRKSYEGNNWWLVLALFFHSLTLLQGNC